MKIMIKQGYTLMEVLAVLAIVSIVTSIVLPGVSNFYSGLQVKAEAEIFVQNVRLARYKAIEEQAVYRLIFPSATDRTYYRVQTHLAFDPDLALTYSGVSLGTPESDYADTNWVDVDVEEYAFETEIVSDLPPVLYFWPNGQIYTDPNINNIAATPIPEYYIGFNYGSAGIKVIITSMGVFSSESYAADEVIITDDTEVIW